MGDIFILYGLKDNTAYYLANTNPIIWTGDIRSAKKFYTRYNAEYCILRDYNNYHIIKRQIEAREIEAVYLSCYDKYNNEIERYKLL